jgi:Flp pilus assembly protein TadG
MKRPGKQHGATIVEMALMLPVFLSMVMAIYEFGRAYNMSQTLTNAAREGARFSVAPMAATGSLPTVDDVTAHVQVYLDSGSLHGSTVTVNQTEASAVNGIALVYTDVQVSAPYQFIFFPYGQITLISKAVMRNETN